MDELVENGEEKADQPLRELSTQVSQQEAAKSELETDAQLDLNSVPLETEETVADNLEKKITSLEHTVAILNTNEATQTSWSDDEEEWCLLSSKAEQSQCLEALLEQVRTKQSQLHRQVQRLCLTGSQQDHFTATDTTRLRGSHTNHLPRQSEEEAGSHRLDNGKGRSMQRTRRLGSPTRAPPACHSPTRHTPVKVAVSGHSMAAKTTVLCKAHGAYTSELCPYRTPVLSKLGLGLSWVYQMEGMLYIYHFMMK
ncbi:uncharacterized protein LOC118242749 [Electrophorus electricus]|uniref:uncharacterized protein LOC118242749 n=1 Tax=Electrophorus electricus TaxID=8005 RepID=UPI0015D09B82|nr:uncharacterized protein LOC118242749 [Electrophorus electricus]